MTFRLEWCRNCDRYFEIAAINSEVLFRASKCPRSRTLVHPYYAVEMHYTATFLQIESSRTVRSSKNIRTVESPGRRRAASYNFSSGGWIGQRSYRHYQQYAYIQYAKIDFIFLTDSFELYNHKVQLLLRTI